MVFHRNFLRASCFKYLRLFQVLGVRSHEVESTARVGIAVAKAALVALGIDKLILCHADGRTAI